MAKQIAKLTKRAVDALKSNGKDAVYWDGELTGFGVRVRKSGRKHYVVQTRFNGRLRWFTIGQHGPFTQDDARAEALQILASAKKGIDPTAVRATPSAAPAMADLSKRFLEEYVETHCKPTTRKEYARRIRLYINPTIGTVKVAAVARRDIAKLHHAMRDKPHQANRTLAVLSKMSSLAETWGWRADGSNPCRHVKVYKERPRSGSCHRKRPIAWVR